MTDLQRKKLLRAWYAIAKEMDEHHFKAYTEGGKGRLITEHKAYTFKQFCASILVRAGIEATELGALEDQSRADAIAPENTQ